MRKMGAESKMDDELALKCLKRFILVLVVCVLQRHGNSLVAGADTLSAGSFLMGNQTIISKNGTFELGFFNPNGTSNWYIGIWYAQIPDHTIIWVANRETPIKNNPGVFSLSKSGYLTVSGDLQGEPVWSSNDTQQGEASMATILDTGNFVLSGAQNTSETVWESFAYPTDHFMPTMKLWKGMKVTSWKSSTDPAAGPFYLQMNPSLGKKDFLLRYKNGVPYYTSGVWTGKYYSSMPQAVSDPDFVQELVEISPTRLYYAYDITAKIKATSMVRNVLNIRGELTVYFLFDKKWSLVYYSPVQDCSVYGLCGGNGVCSKEGNNQSCSCMDGFLPRNATLWSSQEWWSSGCVRRSPLNCSSINTNTTPEGFLKVTDKSLSEAEAVQHPQQSSLQGCRTACLNNCSCTAFSFTASALCNHWSGDLLGMQSTNASSSSDGQPFFIRLAASDVVQLSANPGGSGSNRHRATALYIAIPLGVAFLSGIFIGAWFIQYRRRRLVQKVQEYDTSKSLTTFTYRELKSASNNFSHKLGKGAFGSVYKATLPDNTIVAAKKLERSSQAEKQFRAEISTIGNIHHVNLVRLRGFCVEGSHRILVYEYMANGSLNSFLSSKAKAEDKVLDWKTRFGIALGTARGLLYLHEECRDRIIHCDVKPENILIDADFGAKVADFGLAKLVGRDFSRVLTTTRGTRGYLAPEWLFGLPITVKVDVYSFGMTLLEIISGRRNSDMSAQESQYYFPTWAATQIHKGNMIGILDQRIAEEADFEEVRRAAMVSVLCIQRDESQRPSMGQVVRILEGKSDGDVELYEKSLQALLNDHSV